MLNLIFQKVNLNFGTLVHSIHMYTEGRVLRSGMLAFSCNLYLIHTKLVLTMFFANGLKLCANYLNVVQTS